MIFNDLEKIEWCNIIYKVGIVMAKIEPEILIITISNDVTSSDLSFMNGVSTKFPKTILFC